MGLRGGRRQLWHQAADCSRQNGVFALRLPGGSAGRPADLRDRRRAGAGDRDHSRLTGRGRSKDAGAGAGFRPCQAYDRRCLERSDSSAPAAGARSQLPLLWPPRVRAPGR